MFSLRHPIAATCSKCSDRRVGSLASVILAFAAGFIATPTASAEIKYGFNFECTPPGGSCG